MLPIVELIRLEESYEHGTFGVLKVNKEVLCVTLEENDELNTSNTSSIPAQQFLCERYDSPHFGETFRVTNVPGRTDVLFHAGNTDDDTKGCILLARSYGHFQDGRRAVLSSGDTFKAFMKIMNGHDEFHLTIKEVY